MDKNETTPDELLGSFKGRSLKSIIVFTVVVHAVVLVGSSIPALLGGMAKEDISDMSEEERVAAAVKKANAALEVIDDERDRRNFTQIVEIANRPGEVPQRTAMLEQAVATTGQDSESNAHGPRQWVIASAR